MTNTTPARQLQTCISVRRTVTIGVHQMFRFQLLIVLLLATPLSCGEMPPDFVGCPTLGFDAERLFFHGGDIAIDDSAKGELIHHKFAAHSLAVPQNTTLQLTVSLSLNSNSLAPLLYVYGPRRNDGLFGKCVGEIGDGEAGATARLTINLSKDQGGEYLILASGSPLKNAQDGYILSVECSGNGCKNEVCPTLQELGCAAAKCPGGFSTEVTTSGLECITCNCQPLKCGPHKILVFDTCVCDCPPPDSTKAVCGADGNTWPSACHAQCNQVPVANDTGPCSKVCPQLGCTLDCPLGYKKENGCDVCECVDNPCDNQPAIFQPVCGTDGLTYTNAARARCNPGVEVAYLGSCLPFCPILNNCPQSCEFGYLPSNNSENPCFECDCMVPLPKHAGSTCAIEGHHWCARKIFLDKGTGSGDLKLIKNEIRARTFANSCAAKKAGWQPLFGSACPSGICTNINDCKSAKALLTQADLSENFTNAEVICDKGKPEGPFASSGAVLGFCVALKKSDPISCSNESGQICPNDMKCTDTPDGPTCRYSCECLNAPGSRVYNPVCVESQGGNTTYYNPCMAFCDNEWPVSYPGRCCETRQNVDQLIQSYSLLKQFCQEQDPPELLNIYFDHACPSPPDTCPENEPQDNDPENPQPTENTEEPCCKTKSQGPKPQPIES